MLSKRKCFIIPLLLVALSSAAQEGWTTLTIPSSTRYDDVYFINHSIGWTAGGNSKKIHKTTDGGETWVEKASFPNYLRCIQFMDQNIGLCGSLNGSLYRTTNGGNSWVDVAPNISPAIPGVCGLAKADANTIYGVGIWNEPAFVIKSVNKGLTWTFIDMSAYASSLIDAYFFDANHGFVTGSIDSDAGGIVLYTNDGGQTWVEKFRTNKLTDRIWKIQSPDKVHFFGSIESFTEEGPTRIIRSSDAGQTWEMIDVDPDYYYCQMVGFIDSEHGWTGGRSTLFETTDGGDTWAQVAVGSTYNRFFKTTASTAYMTGSRVYKFTRVVTGVPDEEPYDPIHYLTVSPNPANEKLVVTVNFGNATTAQVYLYGTTGKSIQKVFSGPVNEGERVFEIDISALPAQPMLVLLKTNEGLESVKVLKHY